MKEEGKYPAYPSEGFIDQAKDSGMTHAGTGGFMQFHGLSKREYFAGLAMQGLVVERFVNDAMDRSKVAKFSVKMADALLEELAKK